MTPNTFNLSISLFYQFFYLLSPKTTQDLEGESNFHMAISQTMSNPSDWLFQPYQNDFSHINQIQTSPTNTFSSSAAAAASRANTSTNNNLSPEQGRVAKPIRRRSRASRRTPTTLLNTDTANFRAMVQHFTGGPAAAASVSFAARQQVPNRGASAGYMDHVAAATATPPGGFNVQYPNQVQQQPPHHMFVMDNVHGGGVQPQAAPGSGNRINYDSFML